MSICSLQWVYVLQHVLGKEVCYPLQCFPWKDHFNRCVVVAGVSAVRRDLPSFLSQTRLHANTAGAKAEQFTLLADRWATPTTEIKSGNGKSLFWSCAAYRAWRWDMIWGVYVWNFRTKPHVQESVSLYKWLSQILNIGYRHRCNFLEHVRSESDHWSEFVVWWVFFQLFMSLPDLETYPWCWYPNKWIVIPCLVFMFRFGGILHIILGWVYKISFGCMKSPPLALGWWLWPYGDYGPMP